MPSNVPEKLETIPEGTRVKVFFDEGPKQPQTGRVAKRFSNDGNGPSQAFVDAGITEYLPERHVVVILDDGSNTALMVPFAKLEILNHEFLGYMWRALGGSATAARVLGHCLMEGQGGLHQDVTEGGYWIAYAAPLGDSYAEAMMSYFTGAGPVPAVPPPFRTLEQAEHWPHWGII